MKQRSFVQIVPSKTKISATNKVRDSVKCVRRNECELTSDVLPNNLLLHANYKQI